MGCFSLVHNLQHIILKGKKTWGTSIFCYKTYVHWDVVKTKYPNFATVNRLVVNLTKFLGDPYYVLKFGTNTNLKNVKKPFFSYVSYAFQ